MILGIGDFLYLGLCWLLFPLGGTGEWALASRAWRWLGIPVVTSFYLARHGVPLWTWYWPYILLAATLSLGYGESKPYWYKLLVGFAWAVPSMFLAFTWWQAVLPTMWIWMFIFSNSHVRLAKNLFVWKVVEFTIGFLIGMTFVGSLK